MCILVYIKKKKLWILLIYLKKNFFSLKIFLAFVSKIFKKTYIFFPTFLKNWVFNAGKQIWLWKNYGTRRKWKKIAIRTWKKIEKLIKLKKINRNLW